MIIQVSCPKFTVSWRLPHKSLPRIEARLAQNTVTPAMKGMGKCEAGKDTDFSKDPSFMCALTTPPFYGYKGTKKVGALMVTVGGLLVDEDGRVLDQRYNAIPGLYAAGNASGGRFGWQYFTSIAGQSLSMAETLGMLAGQNAAAALQ